MTDRPALGRAQCGHATGKGSLTLVGLAIGRVWLHNVTRSLHVITFPQCVAQSYSRGVLPIPVPHDDTSKTRDDLFRHDSGRSNCDPQQRQHSLSPSKSGTRQTLNDFRDCELPETAMNGDWVCVLFWGSYLYILRPKGRLSSFVLVGAEGAQTQPIRTDTEPLKEMQGMV
jgi:hypothetical protein